MNAMRRWRCSARENMLDAIGDIRHAPQADAYSASISKGRFAYERNGHASDGDRRGFVTADDASFYCNGDFATAKRLSENSIPSGTPTASRDQAQMRQS